MKAVHIVALGMLLSPLVLMGCSDQGGEDSCGGCPSGTVCDNGVCTGGMDFREVTNTDTPVPDGATDQSADGPDDGSSEYEEICNNGVDDNDDGSIDEGCTCEANSTQSCWPENTSLPRRGVGECREGVQSCFLIGEFYIWGPCEGYQLPTNEVPNNGRDEDCNGEDLVNPACSITEKGEACRNGIDDDCDGAADCLDDGCIRYCETCTATEEICTGGTDEDCDGLTDCEDPDCANDASCMPAMNCTAQFPYFVEVACSDSADNDCDGRIDCADGDCRSPGNCGCDMREIGTCDDQVDNDCDGYTDCGDENCEICTPGSERWCDEPTQCYWGRQECMADSRWGECIETDLRPGNCTGDLYSLSCCVNAGECCQNYPTDQSSVGNCANIAACEVN